MKEEKYIKDKLTDYQSPMDASAMWADLEKSLDRQNDSKPWFFWLKGGKGLLLATALMGLIGYGIWHITFTTGNKEEVLTSEVISENKIDNSEIVSEAISETVSSIEATQQYLNTTNGQEEKSSYNTNTQSIISQSEITSTKTAKTKQTINQSTSVIPTLTKRNVVAKNSNEISGSFVPETIVPIYNTTKPSSTKPHSEKVSKVLPASPLAMINDDTDTRLLLSLADAPSSRHYLSWVRPIADAPALAKPRRRRIEPIENKKGHWRASAFAGQSISDINIGFTSNNALVEYQSIVESISAPLSATNNLSYGVGIERLFRNGFSVKLGLEYMNHGQIYQQADTVVTAVRTAVSSTIYTDPTGNFLGEAEVEEIEVLDLAVAQVRSYHKLNTYRLPVSLGYNFQLNTMDLGISIGGSANYIKDNTGLLLRRDRNNIEEFWTPITTTEDAYTSLYEVSTLKFSADANLELGYTLGPDFRIFAALGAGRIIGNAASQELKEEQFKINMNYAALKLGVSYNL